MQDGLLPLSANDREQLEPQVFARRVAHTFGMASPQMGLLILVTNGLLSLAFWWQSRSPAVLAWASCAAAATGLRILVCWLYRRQGPHPQPALWERRIFLAMTTVGLVYAAGPVVLFDRASPIYNAILISWYVGMVSAHAATFHALPRVLRGYCLLLGGALALRLALTPETGYRVVAVGTVAYCVIQLMFAARAARQQEDTIRQNLLNAELTRRLEEQVAIARRASLERTRFLAAASHDLRQPVHALALIADAMHARLAGTPQVEDVRQIQLSVAALSDSLNAMLDISKLDAGAVQADMRPIELADVFAQLHRQFAALAQRKALNLRFVHRDAVVLADRQLLQRLLANLVDNALKYTERGGVLVAVRRRRNAPDDLIIQVRDNGVGIAAENREQVFDEFFQEDNPGRLRSQGLGIGLSIVRRLVALMDMKLALRSGRGRGTTVELHCRSAVRSARAVGPPTSGHVSASGSVLAGKRVIVVENEAAIAQAAVGLLRDQGCVVETQMSAAAALALVGQGHRFDAALLDFRLGGGMDGLELARRLIETHGSALRVVMVTGDTRSEQISAISASGMAVLYKPVRGDRLVETLNELLARPLAGRS